MAKTDRLAGIDGPVFGIALGCLLLATLPLALAPEASGVVIDAIYRWIAHYLGATYLWAGAATLLFSLYLAFGRYRKVVLGPPDTAPEFGRFSWFSMLFCAGIASGLLYWGVIEWAYYYAAPPHGGAIGSPGAIEWATTYGLFHWGYTAWAFYALPTVAIAHACHRRGEASYRLSRACRSVLGRHTEGTLGKAIDVFFIVGILGGASTSLGLSTPMIAEGAAQLFGIARSFGLDIAIILGCAVIFSISVYKGLDRGIRILSNFNFILAFIFLGFVFLAGDTAFILEASAASLGKLFENFIALNLWSDPTISTSFVEEWTVFYWAWWIAYAPFVGLFVARISRGRTLREVVLGMLLLGSAGSWLFFMVLGNYALALQLGGTLDVVGSLETHGAPATIIAVIMTLPAAGPALAAFCVVSLLYLATTFDSAAYTIAAGASADLGPTAHPSRGHRSFWALALAILPIALLAVGGLRSLQTVSLVASVPLLAVGVLLAVSLMRDLRAGSA